MAYNTVKSFDMRTKQEYWDQDKQEDIFEEYLREQEEYKEKRKKMVERYFRKKEEIIRKKRRE